MSSRDVRTALVASGDETFLVVEWAPPVGTIEALTAAEREVAKLVADGASNAEIAHARGTSARTVANQIAAIMKKVGVGSRNGIARVTAHL